MTAAAKKRVYALIMISLLIGGLVLIDMVIGSYYVELTPERGRMNLERVLSEAAGQPSVLLRTSLHPYLTYSNTINYEDQGIRQHNNLGYRNAGDIDIKRGEEIIRILVIGGSTTYGIGVNNPDQAWPAKLEQLLEKQFNNQYKIEVINAGLLYGTTAEHLTHYLFRDRYLKPDIVIIHSGGNDLVPLLHDNYKPDYTHWRRIKSPGNTGLRPGEAKLIRFSNIIKLFYAHWYSRLDNFGTKTFVDTNHFNTLNREISLRNIKKNEPIGFERNLDLLFRNIRNDGVIPVYFHFYPPGEDLFNDKAKEALAVANERMNYEDIYDALSIGNVKMEESARSICQRHKIEFLALQKHAIPINCFLDQCHLNETGQQIKADFIFDYVFPIAEEIISNKITDIDK